MAVVQEVVGHALVDSVDGFELGVARCVGLGVPHRILVGQPEVGQVCKLGLDLLAQMVFAVQSLGHVVLHEHIGEKLHCVAVCLVQSANHAHPHFVVQHVVRGRLGVPNELGKDHAEPVNLLDRQLVLFVVFVETLVDFGEQHRQAGRRQNCFLVVAQPNKVLDAVKHVGGDFVILGWHIILGWHSFDKSKFG